MYKHKRGDALSLATTVLLPAGSTWSARSHLKTEEAIDLPAPSAQVLAVQMTPLSAPEIAAAQITVPAGKTAWGMVLSATPTQTRQWPAGYPRGIVLLGDTEFVDVGNAANVVSSATFQIEIIKDVTGV